MEIVHVSRKFLRFHRPLIDLIAPAAAHAEEKPPLRPPRPLQQLA
jgi:hypothetical protein